MTVLNITAERQKVKEMAGNEDKEFWFECTDTLVGQKDIKSNMNCLGQTFVCKIPSNTDKQMRISFCFGISILN